MPNNMRWRYGDTNPVMVGVATDSNVEIGDLVFHQSDEARSASDFADLGGEELNQSGFRAAFLGVAMQASPVGDTGPIRVATTGVFEFPCPVTTYALGEGMTAIENASGDGIESQSLKGSASPTTLIGRCAKRVSPGGGAVLVDIVSTVCKGGAQSPA